MGKHYVWNVAPEAMVVRLQTRGLNRFGGRLWSYPPGGPIAEMVGGPDNAEITFELTEDQVNYLVSRPGGEVPLLCVNCYFIKFPDAPVEPKWGYRLQIAQSGVAATGAFSDGSGLILAEGGFHLYGLRKFEPGENVALYRIVMEFRGRAA
jgi:hypothetical protein